MPRQRTLSFVIEDVPPALAPQADAMKKTNMENTCREAIAEAVPSPQCVGATLLLFCITQGLLTLCSVSPSLPLGCAIFAVSFALQLLVMFVRLALSVNSFPDMSDFYGYWTQSAKGRRLIGARCVDTGELAGIVAVEVEHGRPERLEVTRLHVLSRYRGYGLGRRLLEECESTGRRWGCSEVFLRSVKYNSTANTLYHRLGYRRNGKFTYYPFYPGNIITEIHFSHPLDATAAAGEEGDGVHGK